MPQVAGVTAPVSVAWAEHFLALHMANGRMRCTLFAAQTWRALGIPAGLSSLVAKLQEQDASISDHATLIRMLSWRTCDARRVVIELKS